MPPFLTHLNQSSGYQYHNFYSERSIMELQASAHPQSCCLPVLEGCRPKCQQGDYYNSNSQFKCKEVGAPIIPAGQFYFVGSFKPGALIRTAKSGRSVTSGTAIKQCRGFPMVLPGTRNHQRHWLFYLPVVALSPYIR